MTDVGSTARTLTFVFTDIEGSTRLLRALGDGYATVLEQHDRIIRAATRNHGGEVIGSEGDAQFLAFPSAVDAVNAAVEAQRALADQEWPADHAVRVRMGMHTGSVRSSGGQYVGLALHEVARISSAGHGGQILLSPLTVELVKDDLPAGVTITDLGEHRFKDFDEPLRISQLAIEGLEHSFPALRTLGPTRIKLPKPITPFIERNEVAAIVEATTRARLVTLTGPGGTGKTRLSIRVAEEISSRFGEGTYFVALEAVADPALVPSEITAVLGLTSGGPPMERLTSYLAGRVVLLILDNMEQVIEAASDVARLLRECPDVSIIVTSRIPLRIYGEHEFPVPTLPLPRVDSAIDAGVAVDSAAVRLFVDRARAVRADFSLDDANAPVVADVVARLDGLPLAIELAAARMRTLPLEALRRRLDDRLATLTDGARDRPSRQRTLRGTIEWSHSLLDEADGRFFARFSVVAGSAAAEQIELINEDVDTVEDRLSSLVDQSLIRPLEWRGEPRFAMLATIREYAAERLASSSDADVIHRRHASAYLEIAERAAPQLTGSQGSEWSARLEAEHDNLRAALDWIVANDEAELGLRMISALWRFWQVRGLLHEGAERIDRVLKMASVDSQPAELRYRAEAAAGSVAYWRSQIPPMHEHYARALAHARASGDRALLAEALYNQGFAPTSTDISQVDRYRAGAPYFDEALALYHELDDRAGEASALWALSQSAMARGDGEAADRLGVASLHLARELGDPFRIGWAAFTLSLDRLAREDAQDVPELLGEALDLFAGAEDAGGLTLTLSGVAMLAQRRGDMTAMWQLLGASTRARDESGTNILDEDVTFGYWDPNRQPETPEAQEDYERGRRLHLEEAVELARAVIAAAVEG